MKWSRLSTLATFSALIVCCAGSVYAPTTSAIESSGIGILPAHPRADTPRSSSIFIHTSAPGKTLSDAVKIINNSKQVRTLDVYAADSQTSSDGAFACAQKIETPRAVASWINLNQSTVTLQPGASAEVPFTISIPDTADSGEHNGCIAVQASNETAETGKNGIALSFRTAMRVALTVPGNLHSNITVIGSDYTLVSSKLSRISATVRNDGTVSTDTTFIAALDGIWGRHHFSSTTGTYPVFPRTNSTFNFELPNPFWGGWYRTNVQTSFHQINTDGSLAITATKSSAKQRIVFIAPQPLALLIETLITLILIAGVTTFLARRRHQKRSRKNATYHTVAVGETLTDIAQKHHVTWQRIARLNGLRAPYNLKSKQSLLIPSSRPDKKSTPTKK